MDEPEIKMDVSDAMKGFDLLNSRGQRIVISEAKKAAGNIVRLKAASLAPVGKYSPGDRRIRWGHRPGALRRSLSRKNVGLKMKGRYRSVFVLAGVSTEDPYYARWVEMGHRIIRGRRVFDKRVVGHVKGVKFLERAAKMTQQPAFQAFKEKFLTETVKALENRRNRRNR